jgi:hypothetical protein
MFDVTGRKILSRELGALGPGHHVLAISPVTRARPGVYFLRLEQLGRTTKAKLAVTD